MEYEELWLRYKTNNDLDAKCLLIEKYVELVKIVAGRLYSSYGSNIEYDDLVSYGIFGLIDAIEKFDMHKNIKFQTYAQIRIRGSIIDQLRNMDWVPRSIRKKSKLIEEAYTKVESTSGKSATDIDISKELGISIQELHQTMQQISSFNIVSFEENFISENLTSPFRETGENSPENILCSKEIKETLINTIEELPMREKQIILLYYYENLTYKEIGKILEISESRVSQLHSKAITRLKIKLKHKD